jgi:hypothetical protein
MSRFWRDYAVVLGNAGKYKDALPIVHKVVTLDVNQPQMGTA